jgi:putative spermidine/putrescine transport system substrate-binding protein
LASNPLGIRVARTSARRVQEEIVTETGYDLIEKIRTVHLSRRGLVAAAAAATLAARQAWEARAQDSPQIIYDGEVFDAGGATLRIAMWGGPWGESMRKHVLDRLQQDYNCQIAYDDAWPWFPKFLAGGVDSPPFDVTNWNLPELFKTARAGDFFVPVDEVRANVPNSAELWDFAFRNGHGITYLYSQYGFAYRTDLVDPPPTKFTDFWEERFADKRGTYITTNTLQMVFFMMASAAFGKDEKDIPAGIEAMRQAMPMKISDFTGNMQALLERGEVEICVQDDAQSYEPADRGIPVGFYKWTEKEPILTQTLTVSKGAEEVQKRLAYAFINMVAASEYQEIMAATEYQRPTNREVVIPENLASKGVENVADAMDKLWIPDWDWYVDNEQEISESVNEIFGQA